MDLVRNTLDWLPNNIRFLISATYLLSNNEDSPVEFIPFNRFIRKDFILSREESFELVNLKLYGLDEKLRFPEFVELVVNLLRDN
jgi:hypothetical protein